MRPRTEDGKYFRSTEYSVVSMPSQFTFPTARHNGESPTEAMFVESTMCLYVRKPVANIPIMANIKRRMIGVRPVK
jgi:hypothetical protein